MRGQGEPSSDLARRAEASWRSLSVHSTPDMNPLPSNGHGMYSYDVLFFWETGERTREPVEQVGR